MDQILKDCKKGDIIMPWLTYQIILSYKTVINQILPRTMSGIIILWCMFDSFILNKESQVILLIFYESIALFK